MNQIYSLLYHPEAKIDYYNAKIKYAFISEQLEERFIDSIKNALLKLQNNPTFFSVRCENVRIIHPIKFPYNIHFYIEDNFVIVTAIIHNKRNPLIAQLRKTS
jgi:mRNA-degrading endonuclease RelE of RelBE toxin-antitoxin system